MLHELLSLLKIYATFCFALILSWWDRQWLAHFVSIYRESKTQREVGQSCNQRFSFSQVHASVVYCHRRISFHLFKEESGKISHLGAGCVYGRVQRNCWLVVWVLWHTNLWRLFNAKSIFMLIILFQTIQFSMSIQFNCQKHFYFKLFGLFQQF